MIDSKKLSEYIDIVSRASLAALASVYATGVFVVSLHQSRYGLASISLVRTQYMLAGLWVITPLVGIVIFGVSVGSVWHDIFWNRLPNGRARSRRWTRRTIRLLQAMLWAVVCLASSFFIFEIAANFLTGREWSISFSTLVRVTLTLLSFALLIGFCLTGASFFFRNVSLDAPGGTANPLLWGISYASVSAILIVAYVAYFTFAWYENIPSSIGGGAPIHVRFIPVGNPAPDTSVLILEEGGRKSVIYWLLVSTEKSFIVTLPSRKNEAIELDRTAVKAVVYLPP